MLLVDDLPFCQPSVARMMGGAFYGKVLQTDVKTGLKTTINLNTDADVKTRSAGYQVAAGATGGGAGAASLHGEVVVSLDLGLSTNGVAAKRTK
jgi:hypothetical protein